VAVASAGHMQDCTSLQTDNHASTSPLSFFTGGMPFLPPSQQCGSTEGTYSITQVKILQTRKTIEINLFNAIPKNI